MKKPVYAAGVLMGVVAEPVPMIQAKCLDGAWGGLLDVGADVVAEVVRRYKEETTE